MPWGKRLLAYIGWIGPPLVGAAVNLSWWITMLLVIPATGWYVAKVRNRPFTARHGWDRVPVSYALPGIFAIALVVPGLSGVQHFAGCFAAVLLILADLLRGGSAEEARV
jgi:hypothetical protein